MLFKAPINLNMKDAEVIYYPNFFSKNKADAYFNKLLNNTHWQQDTITVFGKKHLQPRLTAFFATNSKTYTYSNIVMKPLPFNNDLFEIKHAIETQTRTGFTSCLANLYRNGKDSNGWHSDNEIELGENPIIASVTFGEERLFKFKHKFDDTAKLNLNLQHGSLLIMTGQTQHFWLHQLPKTTKNINNRINLTFRVVN